MLFENHYLFLIIFLLVTEFVQYYAINKIKNKKTETENKNRLKFVVFKI
jgi:hypothetical protein